MNPIATFLLETNTPASIGAAAQLQASAGKALHLRSLNLDVSQAQSLAAILQDIPKVDKTSIQSISLSYNLIGDEGTIALTRVFPIHLQELGLVGCGISDPGGMALLAWAQQAPGLRMMCIEGNSFSAELREGLNQLRAQRPAITLVF